MEPNHASTSDLIQTSITILISKGIGRITLMEMGFADLVGIFKYIFVVDNWKMELYENSYPVFSVRAQGFFTNTSRSRIVPELVTSARLFTDTLDLCFPNLTSIF